MAVPIHFPDANRNLTKPGNMTDEECTIMYVYTDGETYVSCWQLTDEEQRQLIQNDGKLWVGVLSGQTQPPIFLDVNSPIGYSPSEMVPPMPADYDDALKQFADRLPDPSFAGTRPAYGSEFNIMAPELRTPEGNFLQADKLYFVSSPEIAAMHHNELRIRYAQGGQPAVVAYLKPYMEFLHTPDTYPAQ